VTDQSSAPCSKSLSLIRERRARGARRSPKTVRLEEARANRGTGRPEDPRSSKEPAVSRNRRRASEPMRRSRRRRGENDRQPTPVWKYRHVDVSVDQIDQQEPSKRRSRRETVERKRRIKEADSRSSWIKSYGRVSRSGPQAEALRPETGDQRCRQPERQRQHAATKPAADTVKAGCNAEDAREDGTQARLGRNRWGPPDATKKEGGGSPRCAARDAALATRARKAAPVRLTPAHQVEPSRPPAAGSRDAPHVTGTPRATARGIACRTSAAAATQFMRSATILVSRSRRRGLAGGGGSTTSGRRDLAPGSYESNPAGAETLSRPSKASRRPHDRPFAG